MKQLLNPFYIARQESDLHKERETIIIKQGDNALAAPALHIAESEPRDKELMIRLVMNLLVEGSP